MAASGLGGLPLLVAASVGFICCMSLILPNAANIHDAVDQATVPFLAGFPYLNTPNAGSAY